MWRPALLVGRAALGASQVLITWGRAWGAAWGSAWESVIKTPGTNHVLACVGTTYPMCVVYVCTVVEGSASLE